MIKDIKNNLNVHVNLTWIEINSMQTQLDLNFGHYELKRNKRFLVTLIHIKIMSTF